MKPQQTAQHAPSADLVLCLCCPSSFHSQLQSTAQLLALSPVLLLLLLMAAGLKLCCCICTICMRLRHNDTQLPPQELSPPVRAVVLILLRCCRRQCTTARWLEIRQATSLACMQLTIAKSASGGLACGCLTYLILVCTCWCVAASGRTDCARYWVGVF